MNNTKKAIFHLTSVGDDKAEVTIKGKGTDLINLVASALLQPEIAELVSMAIMAAAEKRIKDGIADSLPQQ